MSTCKKHGVYHGDHGCGIAVLCGSAYGAHSITCEKGVYWEKRVNKEYQPWEAPAENCPICWHENELPVEEKVI